MINPTVLDLECGGVLLLAGFMETFGAADDSSGVDKRQKPNGSHKKLP